MLMTDQQFKLGFAVRAVILVQWHRKLPPIGGKRFIIIAIVLRSSNIVKSEILISTHTSRSAEAKSPTGFGAAHLGDAITSLPNTFWECRGYRVWGTRHDSPLPGFGATHSGMQERVPKSSHLAYLKECRGEASDGVWGVPKSSHLLEAALAARNRCYEWMSAK